MVAANVQSIVGLCWTCNNAPTCFHHARRGPALFCELFDNYVSPDVILASRTSAPARRPFTVPAANDATVAQAGLCLNCEHAAHCGHPKLEGGIWHCEDYE